ELVADPAAAFSPNSEGIGGSGATEIGIGSGGSLSAGTGSDQRGKRVGDVTVCSGTSWGGAAEKGFKDLRLEATVVRRHAPRVPSRRFRVLCRAFRCPRRGDGCRLGQVLVLVQIVEDALNVVQQRFALVHGHAVGAGEESVEWEVGARRFSVVGADDPKLELRPRAGEDVEHQRRDRAIVVEAVSGLQLVGERTGIALVHGPNECFETLVARLEL